MQFAFQLGNDISTTTTPLLNQQKFLPFPSFSLSHDGWPVWHLDFQKKKTLIGSVCPKGMHFSSVFNEQQHEKEKKKKKKIIIQMSFCWGFSRFGQKKKRNISSSLSCSLIFQLIDSSLGRREEKRAHLNIYIIRVLIYFNDLIVHHHHHHLSCAFIYI